MCHTCPGRVLNLNVLITYQLNIFCVDKMLFTLCTRIVKYVCSSVVGVVFVVVVLICGVVVVVVVITIIVVVDGSTTVISFKPIHNYV